MLRRVFVVLGVSVPVMLLSSCAASLDLDRFTKAEAQLVPDGGEPDVPGPSTVTYLDLKFAATGMNAHFNQLMELWIVDKDNRIQAKLLSENIQYPGGVVTASLDFTFYMRSMIPKDNPPYRIDFWADNNKSGTYDGIGGIQLDHAWRRVFDDPNSEDVRLVGTRYEFNFVHSTAFNDIKKDLTGAAITEGEFLLPFEFKVLNASAYLNKMLEMRIVNKLTGQLVGMHRRGSVPETYDIKITGIIGDAFTPYEIRAYVDANDDQKYAVGEPAWKLDLTSAETGLSGSIDLAAQAQSELDPADTP